MDIIKFTTAGNLFDNEKELTIYKYGTTKAEQVYTYTDEQQAEKYLEQYRHKRLSELMYKLVELILEANKTRTQTESYLRDIDTLYQEINEAKLYTLDELVSWYYSGQHKNIARIMPPEDEKKRYVSLFNLFNHITEFCNWYFCKRLHERYDKTA